MKVKFWLKNPVTRLLALLLLITIAWLSFGRVNLLPSNSLSLGRHLLENYESGGLLVLSSRQRIRISLNEHTLVEDAEPGPTGRGLHVVVLNGKHHCTSYRIFDTYSPDEDLHLIEHLKSIPGQRFIILAVKDEASSSLGKSARDYLREMRSWDVNDVGYRSSWVFVTHKLNATAFKPVAEKLMAAIDGTNSFVAVKVVLPVLPDLDQCNPPRNLSIYPYSNLHGAQLEFCRTTDGYPDICSCDNPLGTSFNAASLPEGKYVTAGKITVPVAVIAGNRPFYLNTMLRTLLNTTGVDAGLITVFVDGLFDEPARVASLYGVNSIHHLPGGHSTARITQHYKSSLSAIFSLHKTSAFAIVLEEDLLVSPDFFSYITQTLPLLEKDPSLYCISAWNDISPENATGDPALLYRVETMPGLGWVVARSLFEGELLPQWPSALRKWDWDMWMRSPAVKKDRECIVPDVSRTYHFGARGHNMNPLFHDTYFKYHPFYSGPIIPLRDVYSLTKNGYEKRVRWILNNAVAVNHTAHPCSPGFFPTKPGVILSVFIKMQAMEDSATWLALCKCLGLWNLDVRGQHNGLWRFHVNDSQAVVVVGVPASPYSSALKGHILPIDLSTSRNYSLVAAL